MAAGLHSNSRAAHLQDGEYAREQAQNGRYHRHDEGPRQIILFRSVDDEADQHEYSCNEPQQHWRNNSGTNRQTFNYNLQL